jgi:outer membrane protein OmpA-like peptidoglycan-associated protein
MRRITGMALAFLLSLPGLSSAALVSGRGTTAATFLKIGLGPRAVAMGESYAGIVDDATAVYWNPAGLAQLTAPEITAMHVIWFEGMNFEHLGGALPLPQGVAGVSFVYLNNGTLFRSEAGDTPDSPDRGTFGAADWALSGAYALPIDASMRLGAGLKLFSETLDASASFGWALDVGFHYQLPWPGFTLGAVLQNLGPATRVAEAYARLPINLKVGAAYQALPNLLLAMDYNQLFEQEGRISLGAEYIFENLLALRAGYRYQSAIDNNEYYEGYGSNGLSGLSAGLGLRYHELRLDYAFVPYGFLGATHRIALTYAPAKPAEPAPAAPPAAAPVAAPTTAPTPAPTPAPQRAAERQELEQKLQAVSRRIALGEISSIQFASGSAELTPASQKTVKEMAVLLGGYPDLVVRIEGHTDSQGIADDNLKLSQRRVDAVKDFLVKKYGLNTDHIQAVGYGQLRPIADNQTKAGRAKNRRVEFKVVNEEY